MEISMGIPFYGCGFMGLIACFRSFASLLFWGGEGIRWIMSWKENTYFRYDPDMRF